VTASNPPSGLVVPVCDEDALPFYQATKRGELRIQRCVDTGRWIFPPRPLSPYGSHRAPQWETVSGRGTIWSFIVPHPPLLPAFAEFAPFNVIMVALDEDPTIRLTGNLITQAGGALNEVDPATIEIGAAVRVVFDPIDDEWTLPRWVLA
jgi:uncharacterized OB-fold protein